MTRNFEDLLGEEFHGNAAATTQEVAAAEKALGIGLPEDFRSFLRLTSGGEGMIGENYVMLWSADELARYNESYQVNEYAPGLVLFGSDGGGEAFAFDTREANLPVVRVPFVGMSLDDVEQMASSFTAFLESLRD